MRAMENFRVELVVGRKILVEVRIQRGISQSDSLSSLQFVIAMMRLNYTLSKCKKQQ